MTDTETSTLPYMSIAADYYRAEKINQIQVFFWIEKVPWMGY